MVATLPRLLTMEEALQTFREHGFDLLIADAQVAAAQADASTAAAVANPQVSATAGRSFDYDPALCRGCSATAWSIAITDPSALSDLLSGKRGLRGEIARAAVAAARHSRDEALRALSLQVRQAMLDGALAQSQRDLAGEIAESSERTRALDERRYRAGAISEAELARADVAALQALQAAEVAGQAMRAAHRQIAFLLGSRQPDDDFLVEPGLLERPLPPTPPEEAVLMRRALENRPDLRAASAQRARAEAAVALAKRQRIPDVALSAQYQQEGSGQSALQPPTVTLGVQLPLPIFYRQQGEIARAEADLRAQAVASEKLKAQAQVELQAAYRAVETNRRLVERMRAQVLGRARRARDLVQIQHEKGAASLLEVLDAQRTWAQTESDYLKELRDFWLSVFQLDAAAGGA